MLWYYMKVGNVFLNFGKKYFIYIYSIENNLQNHAILATIFYIGPVINGHRLLKHCP